MLRKRNSRKELVELQERYKLYVKNRDQLITKRKMKKLYKKRIKQQYEAKIDEKQQLVDKNKQKISKLAEKEKIALYTLKNTLNLENNFDLDMRYDIHGCPKTLEFSEKNHKYVFHTNYTKANKKSKPRPKTGRSISGKKSTPIRQGGYLNSSYNKTPRTKGIYYNYEGVYRVKKNNLVGTSPGLKTLTRKFLSSKKNTVKLNEKFKKLIEKNDRAKEMVPIHKQPLNIHKTASPTESTESASRNLNMFETC